MKLKRILLITLLIAAAMLFPVYALGPEADPWPFSAMDWTSECDGGGVRIAVIDTGISKKHIDGARVSDGRNYVFPEAGTDDLVGHGTFIAGILLGSEEMGIQGAAAGAELVPLVYYSRYPSGLSVNGGVEAINRAIYDAVDVFGCRIINISSGAAEDAACLESAVKYAEERGVLIVSAVGNSNLTSPGAVFYPAAYPTVIGIGAADTDLQAAPPSQRNASVMLLASGENIAAVTNRNSLKPQIIGGSSYAAAYVTAAAAHMLERNPALTPADIRKILCETAEDVGEPGYDTDSGWGLLNLSAALAAVP